MISVGRSLSSSFKRYSKRGLVLELRRGAATVIGDEMHTSTERWLIRPRSHLLEVFFSSASLSRAPMRRARSPKVCLSRQCARNARESLPTVVLRGNGQKHRYATAYSRMLSCHRRRAGTFSDYYPSHFRLARYAFTTAGTYVNGFASVPKFWRVSYSLNHTRIK